MAGATRQSRRPGGGREDVDRLNARARDLMATNLERALTDATRADELATAIGYDPGKARALCTIGECQGRLADRDRAREALTDAIALFDALRDQTGEAGARNALGAVEYLGADYPAALEQFMLALSLAQKGDDRLTESNALNGCATTAYALGDYRRAAETFLQSLAIKRLLGDRATEAGCLNNLGLVYQELGDFQQAAKLHREALGIKRALDDRGGEATALANLGVDLFRLGLPVEARPLHEEALRIAREVGNRHTEAGCLENLGAVAESLGEQEAALGLFLHALEVQRELGNPLGEVSALIEAGRMRLVLGDPRAGIADLERALEQATSLRARKFVITSHQALSTALEAAGDLPAALRHSREAAAAESELVREQLDRSTAAVMAGFQIERALREAELERVRSVQLEEANAALRVANAEKERLLDQLRSQQDDLLRTARTDQLTGLPNRRAMAEDLERRFLEARRYGRELAVALVDVDEFKLVNDVSRTHRVGDDVLRTLAAILRRESREVDLVARWGGDEFAVLFVSTTREASAAACERIRTAVEETDWSRFHPEIRVTVSIGLAGSGEAESGDALVFLADERLYEAKEEGRNQVWW